MTCKALKVIDNVGGVDNYLLSLDNAEASQSPYVTKVRELIASTLFHKGASLPHNSHLHVQPSLLMSLSIHRPPAAQACWGTATSRSSGTTGFPQRSCPPSRALPSRPGPSPAGTSARSR